MVKQQANKQKTELSPKASKCLEVCAKASLSSVQFLGMPKLILSTHMEGRKDGWEGGRGKWNKHRKSSPGETSLLEMALNPEIGGIFFF